MSSLVDEMFEFIQDIAETDADRDTIEDELMHTFGIGKGEAIEIYQDWLDDKMGEYEKVSNGDLEAKFEELVEDGFEDYEALEILQRKTGYTITELRKILSEYF